MTAVCGVQATSVVPLAALLLKGRLIATAAMIGVIRPMARPPNVLSQRGSGPQILLKFRRTSPAVRLPERMLKQVNYYTAVVCGDSSQQRNLTETTV